MKVLDLAEYVIRHAEYQGEQITNLKLQKTLYYLQGYSLKRLQQPAFDETIQNWTYGPVVPVAYFAYSSYGSDPLESNMERSLEPLDKKQTKIFDQVIDACLKITARELVQMTHQEAPWKSTSRNQEISCQRIREFFLMENPLSLEENN